jgi:hypothetical protein
MVRIAIRSTAGRRSGDFPLCARCVAFTALSTERTAKVKAALVAEFQTLIG